MFELGGRRWFGLGAALVTTCSLASAAEPPSAPAPPSWSAGAQRHIADAEYEITFRGDAWQAPNRANNLRTSFTNDGIRVVPRAEVAAPWEWGLTFLGAGRSGAVASGESARLSVEGNRMTYDRGGIVEWFVNDARGLEQGFTLAAPPSRARGEVVLEMALTGTLDPSFSSDGQAIDFKAEGGAIVLHYAELNAVDARGRALPAYILLEAMSAEVPVVATAVGGIPDVIGSNEGLLVPPDDPRSLARAIDLVRSDRIAAAARAVAARARVCERFSVATWCESYSRVYQNEVP